MTLASGRLPPLALWRGLLVLLWLPSTPVWAEVAIPPVARVTDLTATLASGEVQTLDARLAALESAKGSQIAVLIVPSTQPEAIEQYAIRVAEAWKLGRKGVDDDALLLVAKEDRSLRIEVGYGLEGVTGRGGEAGNRGDHRAPFQGRRYGWWRRCRDWRPNQAGGGRALATSAGDDDEGRSSWRAFRREHPASGDDVRLRCRRHPARPVRPPGRRFPRGGRGLLRWSEDLGTGIVDPAIRAAFRRKLEAMRHHFRSCDRVDFDFGEAERCFDVIRAINYVSRYRADYETNRSLLGPNIRANYELGAKTEWLDNRIRFNIAIYSMKWDDFAVQVEDPQPGVFHLGYVNLPSADIQGFESEFTFAIDDAWQLDATLGYNDGEVSEATELVLDPAYPSIPVEKGARLPLTPDWTASLGLEYRARGTLLNGQPFARLDLAYVGESVNNLEGIESVVAAGGVQVQEAYQTGDLSFGIEGKRWSTTLFVDNLWDERASLFLSNRWAEQRQSVNRPRTFGLRFRYSWQ